MLLENLPPQTLYFGGADSTLTSWGGHRFLLAHSYKLRGGNVTQVKLIRYVSFNFNKLLCSVYNMLGTVLNTLQILTHFACVILWKSVGYHQPLY